jgi:hypothetical protein
VKELCTRYLADLQAGLILGKGGRPKKASTIVTDTGRIERHASSLHKLVLPHNHNDADVRERIGFAQN